jgi:hypothetical protein
LFISLYLLAAWHTSFVCPKEVSRKRHPGRCRPCGLPCAAHQWRDAKNSLTLRQVWRLIPPPAALLGGTKRGPYNMRVPASGTHFPDEPYFLLVLLLTVLNKLLLFIL